MAQRALVHRQVAERAQQHHDLPRLRQAAGDELRHARGEQARFGLTPRCRLGHALELVVCGKALPAAPVGEQQLHERLLPELRWTCGSELHEALPDARREDPLHGGEDRGAAAEVAREREARSPLAQLGVTLAEEAHVGVAEAIDRLELVADREQIVAVERREDLELAGA